MTKHETNRTKANLDRDVQNISRDEAAPRKAGMRRDSTGGHTPRVAMRIERERTNSVSYCGRSKLPIPITPFNRNCVNSSSDAWQSRTDMKDILKVAVFSQEAICGDRNNPNNRVQKFHDKAKIPEDFYRDFKCKDREKMDPLISSDLKSRIKHHEVDSHDTAMTKLFEGKENPHVIVVIEGNRETLHSKVTLEDTEGAKNHYELDKTWVSGEQSGQKEIFSRQNMHFYIRKDMEGAIEFNEVTVQKGFKVGEINFETENGQKYSILATHIPNNLAKPKNRDSTHTMLTKHQPDQKGRRVVGYIGDTNYGVMMQEFSSPSAGGNYGHSFISPTSSGANKHTFFMQAISFGGKPDDPETAFFMTQPSTLNIVDLNLGGADKTATDHPSMRSKTEHHGFTRG